KAGTRARRSCADLQPPLAPSLLKLLGLCKQIGAHDFDVAAGIQYAKTRGMTPCTLVIRGAGAFKERFALLLEAVKIAAASQALAGRGQRNIKEPGAVRLQMRMHPLLEHLDPFGAKTTPAALVGIGRICKAVANHPLSGLKRRLDDGSYMLATRGKHQQG